MTISSGQHQAVIVIGSGIGGLSMAIILAKLGYNVTVIEKNKLSIKETTLIRRGDRAYDLKTKRWRKIRLGQKKKRGKNL